MSQPTAPLDPSDTFAIEFSTKEIPGCLTVWEVTLKKRHIPNSQGDNEQFRVDMVDHPLYPALCRYVKANGR